MKDDRVLDANIVLEAYEALWQAYKKLQGSYQRQGKAVANLHGQHVKAARALGKMSDPIARAEANRLLGLARTLPGEHEQANLIQSIPDFPTTEQVLATALGSRHEG